MAPTTSKANLNLAIDADEDWSGWADPKLRRKVQNRLNQRATRQRKALEKEQAQQNYESKPVTAALRPLRPRLGDNEGESSRNAESSQAVVPLPSVSSLPPPRAVDSLRGLHPMFEDYQARKMFNTALFMWPMMGQMLMPGREPIETALFRLTLEDELRLDATIYAQWTVMFAQKTTETRTQLLAMSRVLKRVREAIAADSITETVLFCILVLSAKPLDPTPVTGLSYGLFQPPAPNAGCIDQIGAVEYHSQHINLARQLVQARGGISSLKTPGLAEHFQVIDILDASLRIAPPDLELCFSYRYILETEMATHRSPISYADAFGPIDDHFKEIVLDLRHCCHMLDELCGNDTLAQNQLQTQPDIAASTIASTNYTAALATTTCRMLPTYREIVQHRLLNLPPSHPNTEVSRLALLIFSYGVTLPLPNMRPIRSLTRQLKETLESSFYTATQSRELLFWATMVGAMASFTNTNHNDADGYYEVEVEEYLHPFFVNALRNLAVELNVGPSWDDVRGLLGNFVWLSRACDEGARYVWENLFVDPACAFGFLGE